MRCWVVDTKEQRQDGADGRTDHHDRHDRPNVLGHEWNSALGNVGAAKNEVDQTSVEVGLGEVFLTNNNSKGGDQWRNNTSSRNCSHEVSTKLIGWGTNTSSKSLGQKCSTGNVSCLVDWAAHVKCGHATNCKTKDNWTRSRQTAQEVHHAGVDCCHWTRNTQHNQANNGGGKQWVQEDCLQAIKVLWKTCKELLKTNDDITGKEAADDAAQEAKTNASATSINHASGRVDWKTLDSNHTCNKTRNQSRALADRLSNVSRKHWNHEAHCNAADDLKHCSKAVVVRCGRAEGSDTPEE